MRDLRIDTKVVSLMAWSGIVLVVCLAVAQGLLMGFIPPPSPDLSAEEIAQIFIDRKLRIRVATLIECIGFTFYLTFSMSIVMFMRKMEPPGMPILTFTSIANNGGGYVFFLLMPITWATISFRPEVLNPELIQLVNDYVWFIFILSWPPFAMFMIFIAIAVLRDCNPTPIFPRWVGYFNLWTAVMIMPAGLIEFFTTGPFAYNGVISFWWVWLEFFGWIVVMSGVTLRACAIEKRRQIAMDTQSDGGVAA